MPNVVKRQIYAEFLFQYFYHEYRHHFDFKRRDTIHEHSFYNWTDYTYEDFMIQIFQSLSPLRFEPMDQIYNELDEIEKVVYLHEGKFDIGYEINRKRFYVVRFEKTSIAEFEMVYERRIYF